MTSADLDYQAEMLANKTRHYLITTMGRTADEANADEFYRAFSYALREEIMINWHASIHTHAQNDVRMLYYLSMEYLPGRLFANNITNLMANDIVHRVMRKLNWQYEAIMARESDPGLGNGGLGRLASCLLDSLATHHYPVRGYGLRYQYGTFEQQLWNGIQIEAPDCWLIKENPWEFRRDLRKVTVKYCGETTSSLNANGDEILHLHNFEEVWALPYDIPIVGYSTDGNYSVATLRLWSTKESPRNFQLQRYNAGLLGQAAENTTLTDVLYPGDYHEVGKRIRLKQEFLLVSASLQDIIHHYLSTHDNFDAFADKVRIQINDTHPAVAIAELVRIFTNKHDMPWKQAFETVQACLGYTNHTILKEALEEWDHNLFYSLLPRQFKVIEQINHDFCHTIREKFPNDEDRVRRVSIIEDGKVRMANLAIAGAHRVNGVAALHTEILKNVVFKDFYDLFPEKFVNVTNGVSHRRWLLRSNPDLASFITTRIGDQWINDFSQIADLADYAKDPASQKEFLAIKRKNKERLIEFLHHHNRLRDEEGQLVGSPTALDVDSLFDVQVKRVHEYKRQLLNILHLIMLYHEMLENPHHNRTKRTAIFAGKAAASYEAAKDIIHLITSVARTVNRDHAISGALKIVYVENYNVSRAEMIIPAAELSEQISTAGMEASGTGNMKLAMNGALTIGTDDGANIEMRQEVTDAWWPFGFGQSAEEIANLRKSGAYNPRAIYEKNPRIKRALDALTDRSFASTESEHQVFSRLFHKLLESDNGGPPDRYFVLQDLESYAATQKGVETLYGDALKWAEYALHNIAGMGKFSIDESVHNYCDQIWGITPCLPDTRILAKVREEYSKHDQCRIY